MPTPRRLTPRRLTPGVSPVISPVLALVIALAAMVPARRAAGADSANADPWFGRDKLVHFEAAGSLAVVGYASASMVTESRSARAAAGAALAVGAGAAKELWDLDGHGDASWRDFGWDLVGAATGVLISLGTDWLVHRIFQPPPGRTR